MPFLRQSTAVSVIIGPFLSETSGTTLMTAIEVSTATGVDVYKGAVKTDITTTAAGTNAMAHVANAMYSLAFVASQINSFGPFAITANFPSCIPVWHFYDILEEVEYDRMFSAGITVDQIKAIVDDNNNRLEALRIDHVSLGSNVKTGVVSIMISTSSILTNVALWGTSTMIGVASILANVNLWGTSTMIGVASILANQILWGTSSGIAVRSVASQIATMQIENTSILTNVKAGFVSTMIGVSSILSNITALAADHVSLMIDVDSIISNYAQASLLATVDTVVDTILANYAQASLLATVDGVVDAIYLDTTSILVDTATTIPGLITGLNNLSAAQVNAEIVDALTVDTYGEIGQTVLSSVATLKDKIGWLYKDKRNRKTATSTGISIYADDAVTVDQKLVHSDDGTVYDRGEVEKGP